MVCARPAAACGRVQRDEGDRVCGTGTRAGRGRNGMRPGQYGCGNQSESRQRLPGHWPLQSCRWRLVGRAAQTLHADA